MSSTAPSMDSERPELLGSLTTQQQQRTSARVIKKLKLEPLVEKKSAKRADGQSDDPTECDTPNKIDDKDPLKFPTIKQRMPKALWSTDEKSLFFEALNEYGKDFDAITAYICAKMKKKGMPDMNLKTKTQVSHFYYRTWQKLSKHVHFDENVKKVAQELYALINYGELRKKLASVSEKTCARLGEMVRGGSMVVRARGRNMRVRTPACRALRKLNQITERACGTRVCSRASVSLRARDVHAWTRVQAAAHNPRAVVALPLRTRLKALIRALNARWSKHTYYKAELVENPVDKSVEDLKDEEQGQEIRLPYRDDKIDKEEDREDLEGHLQLEPDRIIVTEQKQSKKLALFVGPRSTADIHLPVLTPSEQLSSQKICFSSYLERMCIQTRDQDGGSKIRNPKRQRKDSTTDKDREVEPKKIKSDEVDNKLMIIDETAIDGIELMATYKNVQDDEEKPNTEDEKDLKNDEIAEEEIDREVQDKDIMTKEKEVSERKEDKDILEREKDMSERDKDMLEREKDSFSEMEDDDKYNKSDTDNESDHGKNEKSRKQRKFRNLKVKFRVRPKKRGGSIYTLVLEKEHEEKCEEQKNEEQKSEDQKVEEEPKSDIDVELAIRQIKKGWSASDAGDLTVGDLYLMFGSRSKLELDYWWAEPSLPLPQPPALKSNKPETQTEKDKCSEVRKVEKTPDKATESLIEDGDRARESDTDIFSPKNAFSQDSNDGLSGDERKSEQIASPDHKSSASSGVLKLVSKLVNRPNSNPPSPNSMYQNGQCQARERLKRLLILVGNTNVNTSTSTSPTGRCSCGHVCSQKKTQVPVQKQQVQEETVVVQAPSSAMFRHPIPIAPRSDSQVKQSLQEEPSQPQPTEFRHPTPIAPRPDPQVFKPMSLEGVPRRRRGRPRLSDRRVVVQRLLPLLPKLPPPSNLIPVKIVPNSPPALPKILPKPSPANATTELPYFYMISEVNGQFFFHEGDRRIPLTSLPDNGDNAEQQPDENRDEEVETFVESDSNLEGDVKLEKEVKPDIGPVQIVDAQGRILSADINGYDEKPEAQDIGNFLPSESMSLSPSRILRETEGWFEGSVQDFSLSSFLGHLEGRPQQDIAVDSQLQSLITESSVDYVAKFADLAAEVTDEVRLDEELK